ncbi:helix-turn-helix transcriptional regulator [Actinophytocola sp.]|uniref:helix-turn-helix transcriptional regulator n=1 Tax=Actinophytocola sp. TaxID=1872138 RepID=UPI00389AC286
MEPIRAVAALDDELRRGMYAFIRAARRPVTRDEAAAAVGISRKLAAFHLDKLVDAGVLHAGYQQTNRRVGRAPKVYRPVETDIRVSIPPRQHDLLADILLDGLLAESGTAREAAVRAARERGQDVGAAEREQARPGRLGAERAVTLAAAALDRSGFEPDRRSPTCVRLRTCPFHPLAAKAPELVCGINHAFLTGLVDGLDTTSVRAVLDPRTGECCVELHAN